jgi:DnaK suppressor protein
MDTNKQSARLNDLRAEILARQTEHPTSERHADPLDGAMVARDTYLAAVEQERDTKMLYAVDAALEAIECGDYGICTDCTGEISGLRMEAIPWALKCRTCQEREERTQRELVA